MFSKLLEITGLGMVAWGIAIYLQPAAGIVFAGTAIVFIGSVTDDKSVGMALRRGTGWIRYAWHRQLAKESGIPVPRLRWGVPKGWIHCGCGKDEDCPVCGGTGFIPDPEFRDSPTSPHPKVHVDPQTQLMADQLARQRKERAKIHDRTQALSRYESEEGP